MDSTYQQLLQECKRLNRLQSISGLLGWDERTYMPEGSSTLRAEQQAHYAELLHREASRPEIGLWIDQLESQWSRLTPQQQAVVRDARRDYDKITRLPAEFVARKQMARSASYQAWVHARKQDDFPAFQPHLQTQIDLAREEAAFFDATDPYDYWIDSFDPGMTRAQIEPLFAALKPELKEIVQTILASPNQPDQSAFRGFPVEPQKTFLHEVVKAFGFDFNQGRIDSTIHPFCGGHGLDTRMTTRYDPDNPLDSLTSAMHETGHALYEQGLPDAYAGTALGEAVGMAVHESQSRLWENQVGRSRAFWQFYGPRYRNAFPEQLGSLSDEDLFRAVNKVAISPIRVDADEVTYNLHIMLRFELEKALFDGSLQPADLPEAWNAASTEIVGYTPLTNAEGCLQDLHWCEGLFGYFPSYCLGNLLSAQLWYRILEDIPDLESHIAQAEFQPLLRWLRKEVHQRARLTYTDAFAREVTGAELSPAPLVRYLRERYLTLYT